MSELVGVSRTRTTRSKTDGGRLRRPRLLSKDAGLLAIDRENEYLNSVAAAEAGVGAGVVAYLPDQSILVLEFIEGTTQTAQDLQRGDTLHLVAAACRQLHGAARRFRDDFNMFDIQRRYLGLVQERGFRLPDRYLEFEPQVRAIEEAMVVRTRARCRATTTSSPRTSLTSAALPPDRLRVLGKQRRLLPARERLERVEPDARAAGRAHRPLLRPAAAKQGGARPALGADVEVRLDARASIQDSVSEIDFDFWEWGMEKYERAVAEFDSPGFERLLEDVQRAD